VVAGWMTPVLIILSVLFLGRSHYALYVQKTGSPASAIITWVATLLVIGFWGWQLITGEWLVMSGGTTE
jgi:hypothetical protein